MINRICDYWSFGRSHRTKNLVKQENGRNFVCLSVWPHLAVSALLLFFDLWRFLAYAQLAAPKEALQPSCTRILMGGWECCSVYWQIVGMSLHQTSSYTLCFIDRCAVQQMNDTFALWWALVHTAGHPCGNSSLQFNSTHFAKEI